MQTLGPPSILHRMISNKSLAPSNHSSFFSEKTPHHKSVLELLQYCMLYSPLPSLCIFLISWFLSSSIWLYIIIILNWTPLPAMLHSFKKLPIKAEKRAKGIRETQKTTTMLESEKLHRSEVGVSPAPLEPQRANKASGKEQQKLHDIWIRKATLRWARCIPPHHLEPWRANKAKSNS